MRRQLGFRGRLVVGAIALATGFIALAVVTLSMLLEQFANRQVTRDLDHARTSYSTWQQQKRRALRERAEFLSRQSILTAAVGTADAATVRDTLRDFAPDDPATAIWVLDALGVVLGATRALPPELERVTERPGVAAAAGGTVADSVWLTDSVDLVALSPILQGDAVVGILALTERIGPATARSIAEATSRDVTVLSANRLVAHIRRDHDDQIDDLTSATALAETIRQTAAQMSADGPPGPSGNLLEAVDAGERHVGLALPLHPDGGLLVLSRGLAEIDWLSRSAWRALLLAGGVIAGLGILGSTRMAWRLARPLAELTEATATMAGGSLFARVQVTGNDEIGRLGVAFNEMAARIGTLIEDVRHQAHLAATANRATDSFLASVSHELRTPITNIAAYGELLQQFGADAEPQERDEFLGIIRIESMRLAYLVDQIMDFTRLESGQVHWRNAVHDLRADVDQAIATWKAHAQQHEVAFVFDRPADEVLVLGDGNELVRAIGKLLHNAVNFSPRSGEVTIALRGDAAAFALAITDHGLGVPDDVKERVFERFYQGGNTLTAKPPGTGLGLTIARTIAVHHGYTIGCTDAPGGGACFTLAGPLAASTASTSATPTAAPAAAATLTSA